MANVYMPSAAVAAALKAVEDQKKSRPESYRSAWDAQIQQAMDAILNRENFHYNLNGDALYQQYKQQAIRNGRLAMMDTMGQAAALTGGYGNSYAETAGQQAYQQNLATLNDRIPQLYAMALAQYRQQGDDLQKRYELMQGREQQDYSRYQDILAGWQRDADRLWNIYTGERDFDYGSFRDSVADAQWQAEFDEAQRRYNQEWALKTAAAAAKSSSSGGGGTSKKTTSSATNSTIKKSDGHGTKAEIKSLLL